MTPRTARLLLVLGAFITGLVLFSTVVFIITGRTPTPIAGPSAIGGAFQLVDQNSKPITDKDIKGYPTLVFFGFTNCPDICPTTLFEVSEIMRSLGKDADKVKALFVSVDPERDTPEKMKDYLSSFDPHLVGVTGDVASITAMGKAYRVYFKKVPLDGGSYTMDHTAIVYLMDKDGRFVAPFNMKRRPEEAAADLRRYL
ncbi:MAG: SCO family protein [Pseudomonadota bacterium]